jgi:hypothetical protein
MGDYGTLLPRSRFVLFSRVLLIEYDKANSVYANAVDAKRTSLQTLDSARDAESLGTADSRAKDEARILPRVVR